MLDYIRVSIMTELKYEYNVEFITSNGIHVTPIKGIVQSIKKVNTYLYEIKICLDTGKIIEIIAEGSLIINEGDNIAGEHRDKFGGNSIYCFPLFKNSFKKSIPSYMS